MNMEERLVYYQNKIKEKKEKFDQFYSLLIEYNKRYNLTAITEKKDVEIKHFLDSVAGEFLFPVGARVIEIGSGAGFPSLPLKILREDLQFTLLESIGKKCEFLKVAIKELCLTNVEVINARAEDFSRTTRREVYDVVCARAVARMNTLAEYCVPFIKKGGLFIAYKGGDEEEIQEASKAFTLLGVTKKAEYKYDLPEQTGKRNLIVLQKIKNTPEKYPRGNGKERKAPLL